MTLVITFQDYIKFIVDTMKDSEKLDSTFSIPDVELYDMALRIEPVLDTIERIYYSIGKSQSIDDVVIHNPTLPEKIVDKLQTYLDNLDHGIGYDFINLYSHFLEMAACMQIIYCAEILKKNAPIGANTDRTQRANKPFRILTTMGSISNFIEDSEEHEPQIQFITEVRTVNHDQPLENLLPSKAFLEGDIYTLPTKTPSHLQEIGYYLTNAIKPIKDSVGIILENANMQLNVAKAVKEDLTIYHIKLNI